MRSMVVSMRSIVVLGLIAALVGLSGEPAGAHAALVSSDPAAAQRLATTPALVLLRFTEPLNDRLSRATVIGPDGQRFQGGASGPGELRVRLPTEAPGVYRVAWATVSVVDGHTLHGGFAFGVRAPVAGQRSGQREGRTAAGPRLDDVLIAAVRAAEDAALLVAMGMLLLIGLAGRDPRLPQRRPRVRLAAGLWAGGIMALATMRPRQGWTGPQGRALLARFSPVALAAFLVATGFGLVQALQQVGSVPSLLSSSYGRVLGIKLLAVAAMVPLSVRAWRRRPAFRLETALGLTAVTMAALLAAYPLPPARLARAEAEADRPTPNPAMPRPGDLTLASHVGPVLIGLTIRPGSPGRNDLLIYLLPADGELVAATIPVAVSVDGRPVQVDRCGPACRRSAANLAPGARVQIGLAQPRAGVVAFRLPLLPAPDGSTLLVRMQARMHHLTTLRYREVLTSGLDAGSLRSSYQQQAPDRLQVQTSAGSQSVWIGATMYRQAHPGAGWIAQPGVTPYTVPSFVWDYLPTQLLDPRIVGTARVDGVATKILTFFGPSGSAPIWFRLWVDPAGLVRRAEMRAAGHFMDQRYDDFDGPAAIEAPLHPR